MGSAGLPRDVLKWVLSLDLSYPVKNVRREFANGFLFAEVLSRYFPADVHMHSFENVSSSERKKSNWALLTKLFKKRHIPADKKLIESIMAAEGESATELLGTLHAFIHSPAYESAMAEKEEAHPRDRSHDASTSKAAPKGYANQHANEMKKVQQQTDEQAEQQQAQAQMLAQQQQMMQQQQMIQQQQGMAAGQYGAQGAGMPQQYGYGVPPQQQMKGPQASNQRFKSPTRVPPKAPSPHSAFPPPPFGMPPPSQQSSSSYASYGGHNYVSNSDYVPQAAPVGPMGMGGGYANAHMYGGVPTGMQGGVGMPNAQGMYGMNQMGQMGQMGGYAAMNGGMGQGMGVMPEKKSAIDSYMQQIVQARHTQELLQQQQQQLAGLAVPRPPMSNAGGVANNGGNGSYGNGGAERPGPEIPFSKPRPVEYSPYDQKDFEDKDYNVKKANYWELGRLGPDLATDELQAKRENQERVKAMAAQVREENLKAAAIAAQKPKKGPEKELSAREKALQFAKNVPKPEPGAKLHVSPPPQRRNAIGARKPGGPDPKSVGKGKAVPQSQSPPQQQQEGSYEVSEQGAERPPMTELEILEAQHEADLKRVEEIRAELARACR